MAVEGRPPADVTIDAALVRALLRAQHPDLASLPLAEAGEGWDNKLYRLGTDLLVRLPRRQLSAALIDHEVRWLPQLAPRLPLKIPSPVRVGTPALGYPWTWTVSPWLAGDTAAQIGWDDGDRGAAALGSFVAALHQPAPIDAPSNPFRRTLHERSDGLVERVERLATRIDGAHVLAAWHDALHLPAFEGPPVWLHGDLHPGNLIVRGGHVEAVIDFGDLTSGDPAIDLSVAWMLWTSEVRQTFRAAAGASTPVDDDTWARARGWALSLAVAYLAHSADTPWMARVGRRTIDAVLAESPQRARQRIPARGRASCPDIPDGHCDGKS